MDGVSLVPAGRLSLGLGTFFAPGPALRPVGIDAAAEPRLAYLSRIAGSRSAGAGPPC